MTCKNCGKPINMSQGTWAHASGFVKCEPRNPNSKQAQPR